VAKGLLTSVGEFATFGSIMGEKLERIEGKEGEVLWSHREEVVEEIFDKVIKRYTFLKFVEGIAQGEKTKVLLNELKIQWTDFVEMYCVDKRLYNLYLDAKERGELYRQALREDEADKRALEGVLKPQFHKGEICGYVREYSDQLLALQLKAGNPDKYADRKDVSFKGAMLNLNVQGVEREKEGGES